MKSRRSQCFPRPSLQGHRDLPSGRPGGRARRAGEYSTSRCCRPASTRSFSAAPARCPNAEDPAALNEGKTFVLLLHDPAGQGLRHVVQRQAVGGFANVAERGRSPPR